jgi:hypothetical protein
MKKMLKISALLLVLGLVLGLAGCPGTDDDKDGNNNNNNQTGNDGIKWTNDADGTLTVLNNTTKDMVLFQGQTPTINNILGGVRGGTSRDIDLSSKVSDFNTGGFIILRGITLDQYNANKSNLNLARIEYSAMATYGRNMRFRTEIMPSYIGDYGYKVNNIGRIGMELRKGSPDGEKVAYLPSLASDMPLYADSTATYTLYPVYVYFSRNTGQVTTLKPTSMFETVTVAPRALTGSTPIQSYIFPADQGATWDSIKGTLSSPVAYVTVTSNVPNQTGRVTIAGTSQLTSQNGLDGIGSGETWTYEITSTASGTEKALVLQYYGTALSLPVKLNGNTPVLKNGYDYNVTVSGSGSSADGYTVTCTESDNPRDLSSDIASL